MYSVEWTSGTYLSNGGVQDNQLIKHTVCYRLIVDSSIRIYNSLNNYDIQLL